MDAIEHIHIIMFIKVYDHVSVLFFLRWDAFIVGRVGCEGSYLYGGDWGKLIGILNESNKFLSSSVVTLS